MSVTEETPTPDATTSSSPTASRRNNNGGNGQRNRKKTAFKGEIDELGSHVFTTPHEDSYKSQDYRKNIEAFELYFERSFSDPDDMICVLSNEEPKKLITPEKILRGQEIKEYAKRDRLVRTKLKKAYTIIWAQCVFLSAY